MPEHLPTQILPLPIRRHVFHPRQPRKSPRKGPSTVNFTHFFDQCGKVSSVGVIGATKGYGYTLLAQIPKVNRMTLRLISSRHPEECIAVLTELGYPTERFLVCESAEAVRSAPRDAILIVKDYRLALESDITALVECTGNTAVSADAAAGALRKGINVYMVSKETDSVCGPMLSRLAQEHGAIYALVNGDQPRNLVDLYSWGKTLGLTIIAAGKASEYDYVWNPDDGTFFRTDCPQQVETIPGLREYWHYQGRETLQGRQELLKHYTGTICADLCEMNLVSNVTGLVPARPCLSYPIAKPSELADILIPEEDGGILKETGVVDVFYNLRAPDEASFAGGEFLIVKCDNAKVWEVLRGKGHVVSKNGKYACLYYPYHIMGVESPLSLLLGDLMGIGGHPECRQVSVLVGVAASDLPAGTELNVAGHNHAIAGLLPQLHARSSLPGNVAPYYLLGGTKLIRDVAEGSPITMEDVDLSESLVCSLYLQGLAL